MGQTGREGRTVVKGVLGIGPFEGESVLGAEGGFGGPFAADFFFGFGKVECWWEGCHDFDLILIF